MADNNKKMSRFIHVAERRTNNVLRYIRLLGNCSNRQNYEYEQEDIRKIFITIENELKRTKNLFESASGKNPKFRLKED